MEAGRERAEIDALLRSRMEQILATEFADLHDGSETVTQNGLSHTITWTILPIDLDGDSVDDPTAREVRVETDSSRLATIVVDHEGKLGKI